MILTTHNNSMPDRPMPGQKTIALPIGTNQDGTSKLANGRAKRDHKL